MSVHSTLLTSPFLADEIQALLSFRGDPFPVSSLYLTLDRARDPQRGYIAALKNLIREAGQQPAASFDREQRRSLEADWAAMIEVVEGVRGFASQGLAIFSCNGRGFWSSLDLPAPVANRLQFGSRPYLGPLVRLRGELGSGLVLVVGRDRARLLRVREGRVVAEERWEGDVPQRVKEAGWASLEEKRIDHHVLDHLHRHLKESASRLVARFRQERADWVLVGGSDEPRALLERHLPPDVAACLIGRVDVPVEAPTVQVLESALARGQTEREGRVASLFSRLGEAAAAGWGTLGFTDTAAAAGRGALATLLMASELSATGCRCSTCGMLLSDDSWTATARCPNCAGETAMPVGDACEELICDALGCGAEVVLAAEGPDYWRNAGSVGGLLRY